MKILFDLFPVLLFFVAYKTAGIYAATVVAIAATLGQIAWVWFRYRKVETMLWVSLAIVSFFGGMTLFLHDESFIKWKPTVLYWIFAGALLFSQALLGKNLIRSLLADKIVLNELIWRRLNGLWIAFFSLMGMLNLIVAFNFSTDDWVNFKLFGSTALMLVFIFAQGIMLSKHIQEQNEEKNGGTEPQQNLAHEQSEKSDDALERLMRERLSSLSPEQLDLIDESALHLGHAGAQGGGKHYRLSIASPEFVGKSTIVCHRMIYDALGDLMHSRIHALSIQCVSSPG